MEGPLHFLPSLAALTERLEGLRGDVEDFEESSARSLATKTAAHILEWVWSRSLDLPLDLVVAGAPPDQRETAHALVRHLAPHVVAILAVQWGLPAPGGGDAPAVEGNALSSSDEVPGAKDGEVGGPWHQATRDPFCFAC